MRVRHHERWTGYVFYVAHYGPVQMAHWHVWVDEDVI
jgi:hypothetical protein